MQWRASTLVSSMWTAILAGLTACWLTLTSGVALGRTHWLIFSLEYTLSIIPLVMLAVLFLSFKASNELCMWPQASPQSFSSAEWFTTIPSTLFGALTIQAATQMAMTTGIRTSSSVPIFTAIPCLGVHVCTTAYYLIGETLAPPCVLATRWDTESRPFHYALWWVSMGAQMVTLRGLECALFQRASKTKHRPSRDRTTASAGVPPATSAATTQLKLESCAARQCAFGLACSLMMLLLTLYVDVLHGPLFMLVPVFAAFYGALYAGVCVPLQACSTHVLAALPPTTGRALSFRFRAIAVYLGVAWHMFPVVWALEIGGATTANGARFGYVIADVLAKFLPVTLYVSAAQQADG